MSYTMITEFNIVGVGDRNSAIGEKQFVILLKYVILCIGTNEYIVCIIVNQSFRSCCQNCVIFQRISYYSCIENNDIYMMSIYK